MSANLSVCRQANGIATSYVSRDVDDARSSCHCGFVTMPNTRRKNCGVWMLKKQSLYASENVDVYRIRVVIKTYSIRRVARLQTSVTPSSGTQPCFRYQNLDSGELTVQLTFESAVRAI